jgi:hydrogenase expression/formation protein HypD
LPAARGDFLHLRRRHARAGKNGSLLQAKARGADVRIVYSPMDALKLAQQNPQREVVFLASVLKPPCPPPP